MFLVIALMGLMFYSTGRPPEIADRVIVHAVGVDVNDNGYKVTLQVFSPEGSGSDTPLDPSKPNVRLVNSEGRSVAEAAEECRRKLGGELFLGQNRLILFGKNIDLSRSDELFGYFLSASEAFLNVDCAAAEPSAEKLLSVPVSAGSVASERFVSMIRTGETDGTVCGCSLTELITDIQPPSEMVMMPLFTVDNMNKDAKKFIEKESPIRLSESAVFKQGKYSDSLSPYETGIISAVSGRGKYFFTQSEQNTQLIRVRSRELKADEVDGKLCVTVHLNVSPAEPTVGECKNTDSLSDELTDACEKLTDKGYAYLLGQELHLKRFAPKLYKNSPCTSVTYRVNIN